MILPTPNDASAQAGAAGTRAHSPATGNTTPQLAITTARADAGEIRRLRNRLLKLILENQHRREDHRLRNLPARGAG